MKAITVDGVLLTGTKGLAVEVPFDPEVEWHARQVRLFPGRRGYPVQAVLKRVRFASAILCRRGHFFVLVDEGAARHAGVRPGDPVRVRVSPGGPVVLVAAAAGVKTKHRRRRP
jgi:hypothetical protein